jgi:hypothetical protein
MHGILDLLTHIPRPCTTCLLLVSSGVSALKADDQLTHVPLFQLALKLKNLRSFSHRKQSIIIFFIPTQLSQPNSMP